MDDITLKKVYENKDVRDVVAMMTLKEVGAWDIPNLPDLTPEQKAAKEAVKMRVYRYALESITERMMKILVSVPNIKDGANPLDSEGVLSASFIAQVVQSVTTIMQTEKYYPYILED